MNLTMEEESLPWVGTEPYPWWAVVPDQLTNKNMEEKNCDTGPCPSNVDLVTCQKSTDLGVGVERLTAE